MKVGEITRCWSFSEGSDRCSSCKCVDVDLVGAIQGIVDEAHSRIAAGAYYLGRTWSLKNDHIARINKATQREIDMIKAGIPMCRMFDYREGRYENQVLMPREEWFKVAS